MADFMASNVSSTVAIWKKAYNSYPSKAVIFPDRWSQQHRCYTGTWACLCQWSLAWVWESTGQNISSFCLQSPSSDLWKDPDWLAGSIPASWRKTGAKPWGKRINFPAASAFGKSFVSFSKPPESMWAQLSLCYCYHSTRLTCNQFRRRSLTTAVVQTGNLNWSK